MKLKNAHQVAQWRLCIGCGACAYVCPEQNITLINIVNSGIRPTYDPTKCKDCGTCIEVCPGYETIKESQQDHTGIIRELNQSWGTILEVWEGYATDPDIRFRWFFRRAGQRFGPVLSGKERHDRRAAHGGG